MAESSIVLPLAHTLGTRDGTLTKDCKLVNCLVEVEGDTATILKRPGLALVQELGAGKAQGMGTCNGQAYAIVRDTLHKVGSWETWLLPSITVPYERFDVLSDVPLGKMLLKSPSGLWVFDGVSLAKVTDVNYPPETVSGLECLDGTYYVMKTDGTICGSVIQDPTTWEALNFIGADPAYGRPVGLHRHLNYLITSYAQGTQAYYDAGNPSGSPLSPVGNASWTTGAASGSSVVELGDDLFFMATSQQRGRFIAVISGLQLQPISTPAVERVLGRDPLTEVFGFGLRTAGHRLYVLTLVTTGITLVFDVASQVWSVWSSGAAGSEAFFNGVLYLNDGSRELLQGYEDGVVYELSESQYTDNGTAIAMRVVTPPFDAGTLKRKFIAGAFLHSDTVQGTCSLRYSDDDYATHSAFRSIPLATTKKRMLRLGSTRRRSWEMLYEGDTGLRVRGLELDLGMGSA